MFELEQHPQKKGNCPKCKQTNCFRYYSHLPRDYGVCDHVNSCDYKNVPHKQPNEIKREIYKLVNDNLGLKGNNLPEKQTIYPNEKQLDVLKNNDSNFHKFCSEKLKITEEHLKRWNVGADERGNTAFVFQDITGKALNIKMLRFDIIGNGNDCKRNRNTFPFYLKAPTNQKYKTCLYGEHLIQENKISCLCESEKTAIISSFFYPQFNWLATSGSNGLTVDKVQVLLQREVYYVGDNDKAGKENSTLKKLTDYGINYKTVAFDTAKESEDLADLIIRGERPEIKPSEVKVVKSETINPTISKNQSTFEKVENFISERYDIRNNIVANKIEIRAKNEPNAEFKQLNENNIYRELQKNFVEFSLNKLKSCLGSDFVKEFNPFVDYFENLPTYKESEPDYILNLCQYIPVKDKPRFEVQFKKMLVRCIACSLNNVVNKQAFILVHNQQNSGKTTFLRWLTPPLLKNYIAENINTDKDSLIAMCTNFFINMDELATLNRSEINALKSIMSKDVFKGRLPYGAREVNLIRRANIIGSTNNTEFLSDDTGSVRWLCFELTEKLNFNYKTEIDIDNVWKQAYFLFKNGFKFELTPAEIQENERVNESHRIVTIEQELIQNIFLPSQKDEMGNYFKTATEIKIILAQKYPSEKLNNVVNIGKALNVLGFSRTQEKKDNIPIKGYYLKYKPEYWFNNNDNQN